MHKWRVYRLTDKLTETQMDKLIDRQAVLWTDRFTDRVMDRQADRQCEDKD